MMSSFISGRAIRSMTVGLVVITVLLLGLGLIGYPRVSHSRVQQVVNEPKRHDSQVEQHRNDKPRVLPWAGIVSVANDTLLKLQWVRELRAFVELSVQPQWPIAIVSASYEYTEMLLNWLTLTLVVIEEPIHNVLVLALDESIHVLMKERGFASFHISLDSADSSDRTVVKGVTTAGKARTTVMRLLLHWGYDVANYDTDALVFKNPQPLYDRYRQSDVIGTVANTPPDLLHKWGFTVCFGAVMMRATHQTGTGYVTNLSVFVSHFEFGAHPYRFNHFYHSLATL